MNKHATGTYCIAPGCTNSFYSFVSTNGKKHFHKFPARNPTQFNGWIHACKRNITDLDFSQAKLCSEHFIEECYETALVLDKDTGRYIVQPTNKLKPGVLPTVFNFSAYSSGQTDAPTPSCSNSCGQSEREARLCKRQKKQEKAKVSLILLGCINTINIIFIL